MYLCGVRGSLVYWLRYWSIKLETLSSSLTLSTKPAEGALGQPANLIQP